MISSVPSTRHQRQRARIKITLFWEGHCNSFQHIRHKYYLCWQLHKCWTSLRGSLINVKPKPYFINTIRAVEFLFKQTWKKTCNLFISMIKFSVWGFTGLDKMYRDGKKTENEVPLLFLLENFLREINIDTVVARVTEYDKTVVLISLQRMQ